MVTTTSISSKSCKAQKFKIEANFKILQHIAATLPGLFQAQKQTAGTGCHLAGGIPIQLIYVLGAKL